MSLKAIYLILIIMLISFYPLAPTDMNKETMVILFGILVAALVLFAFRKEKVQDLKGQFLKHSTFILLGVIIVHFQYYLDYVLGNTSDSNMFIWVDTRITIKTMMLSLIGICCFLLGYLVFKHKPEKIGSKKSQKGRININLLLTVASFALVIYFFTVNPMYLMGYYGEEQIGAEATYAIMVFRLTIYAIIIQNCRNMVVLEQIPTSFKDYVRKQGMFVTVLIAIYLASVLLSGDRGPLMTFSICYLSGYYFITKRKMSFKYGFLIVLAGAAFITILGQVRRMDNQLSFSDRFAQSINSEALDEESILPQTKELAGSVMALHHAVANVPDRHDYLYGRFQFQQIAVAIPFFDSFNPLIFNDQHYRYGGSARFITWLFQGETPRYGNGTSCITDFYLDFGLIGVIVGMFFFGYVMRYAEIAMYSLSMPKLLGHVFFVVYLSNAIYISRSTVLFQFKSMMLIFVIIVANRYIVKNR